MGNRSLYTVTGDVLTLTGVMYWHVSTGGFASGGGWSQLVIVLWLDGCQEVEPRIWLALPEGLCEIWGGSLRLKAFMIGCRWAVPLFIYTLAFALQLRKSTGNLSQDSRALLGTASWRRLDRLVGVVSTGLQYIRPLRLTVRASESRWYT
jgi:hypothetical protein